MTYDFTKPASTEFTAIEAKAPDSEEQKTHAVTEMQIDFAAIPAAEMRSCLFITVKKDSGEMNCQMAGVATDRMAMVAALLETFHKTQEHEEELNAQEASNEQQ